MKTVILGGVAAGTKAAAKLKREDRGEEVLLFTKGTEISYAGCGLPYYVGDLIETEDELIVNTPDKFAALTGVQLRCSCEAIAVKPDAKTVTIRDLTSGVVTEESYDRLIIATGATPIVPPIEGAALKGVFTLRQPKDAVGLRAYVEENNCAKAVVVGGSFIGLEIAENLHAKGLSVTVLDMAPQILPNLFDREMADYAKRRLQDAGIRVLTATALDAILGDGRVMQVKTPNGVLGADVVVLSVGIRPATDFLKDSGIERFKGAVVVNANMETNLPKVYAVGDCALVYNRLTGKPQWSAMGSTANLAARSLARRLGGEITQYDGCLGTGVIKLLKDWNAGRTGLTEEQARTAGFDPVSVVCITDDKAHYYPGADSFLTKLIADRSTEKLLGIQVFGAGVVDKMVDIAVAGIGFGAKLGDFDTMDFAYAPPFSTAIHPFTQACNILENKLYGELVSFTPAEYEAGAAKDYRVIDAQPSPKIPGAKWLDLTKVNGPVEGLAPADKLLLVCAKGKSGYFLQNRLRTAGYTNTRVLEGGALFNRVRVSFAGDQIPPEEVKRVKGLGCLQDKRYLDRFNVRVITRNGKLTAAEQLAVAEAAARFGSGETTMTTRLTLEIQDVPFDKLDECMEFLSKAGLSTGGTGSKVRPVVSCKGTTCQYGLIDTFELSERIHTRFYEGYHNVVLPHKFKIAVGGCPNNCVKPDLNDLGIVGQKAPLPELSLCKGCKVCQVEKACPIHIAHVENGKLTIAPNACNHCGRCEGKCPFHALDAFRTGYKITIGGRWGKQIARGLPLDRLFTTEDEVMDTVEKAILLFRDEGRTGERFSDTVARLGFAYVQDKLLNGALDREAVLKKDVVGGATC